MTDARYDGYSPFMSAVIVTQDGARAPLWVAPDGATGITDRPFLTELVVKLNLGFIPIITARLGPSYDAAIEFLDSEHIEFGESRLEVQFGYTAGAPGGAVLSPLYTGLLLRPDVQLGDDIGLTLNAQGITSFTIATQGGARAWNLKSRSAIIEDLLRGPGTPPRDLRLDASEVQSASAEVRTAFFETPQQIAQGALTDWQLITQLIRECRCWFLVVGNTVKVFPRESRLTGPPCRTFAVHNYPNGELGPAAGVFPMFNPTSPTTGIYLPGSLRGLAMSEIDSRSRQVVTRSVNDEDTRGARTSAQGANGAPSPSNPGVGPRGEGQEQTAANPTDPRFVDRARAEYETITQRSGIKLEWSSLGIPEALPGDVVAVRGLGRRIDSANYALFEVTHTFNASGFETAFSGFSNVPGVQVDAARQISSGLGPINTHTAPTTSANAVTIQPEPNR